MIFALGRFALLLVLLVCAPVSSWAQQQLASGSRSPFTSAGIVLLQPSEIFEERLPSADELAHYINDISEVSRGFWWKHRFDKSAHGELVVAMRPRRQRRVWWTLPDTIASSDTVRQYLAAVQKVSPPELTTGTLVFAIRIGIGRDYKPADDGAMLTTGPLEWTLAVQRNGNQPMHIEQLVNVVWPWE